MKAKSWFELEKNGVKINCRHLRAYKVSFSSIFRNIFGLGKLQGFSF